MINQNKLNQSINENNIDNIDKMIGDYELKIDISYEYNDNVEKGMIISQSIDKETTFQNQIVRIF